MEDIEFKINKNKIEGLQNWSSTLFPSHFLCIICGKPGKGKTSLIKQLLTDERLFFKKFDYVFCVSPSIEEFSDLFLPKSNTTDKFTIDWIFKSIQDVNSAKHSNYINVLFIIDDFVSELYNNRFDEMLTKFSFNRRHLINNGMVSIIITSQKYNVLPTRYRCTADVLVLFSCAPSEVDEIQKNLIYNNVNFKDVCSLAITNDSFLLYNIQNESFFKNFTLINTKYN